MVTVTVTWESTSSILKLVVDKFQRNVIKTLRGPWGSMSPYSEEFKKTNYKNTFRCRVFGNSLR